MLEFQEAADESDPRNDEWGVEVEPGDSGEEEEVVADEDQPDTADGGEGEEDVEALGKEEKDVVPVEPAKMTKEKPTEEG